MARFWQRTKDRLTAPAQYIQVTDSVSRPMAVMMTLVMFFVAIAVIVGLFFVGKWGYEQITGKSDKPANPITGISTGANTSSNGSDSSSQNSGSTATVTSNGTGTAAVTPTQPSTTSVTPTTTGQTSTSATTGAVPNTGAGGTLVVFVVSSIAGTLLYRFVLLRKLN